MNVDDYDILQSDNRDTLISMVRDQRQYGWQPWGGLAVVNCGYRRYLYVQVMVRDNYDWGGGTSKDKQ